MAVTVGRIEYVVGADGKVLTKESRDAARKAGKLGGKTFSDSFNEDFRKRFGGASGFAKTLGKYDKQVINQFHKLGGFSSQAFATRFEKTLRPAYQRVANNMLSFFAKLRFNPLTNVEQELKRIIGPTEDVEGALTKLRDTMEELSASGRLGLIDDDRIHQNISSIEKLGAAARKAIEGQNWELLTDRELELRDAIDEVSRALDEETKRIRKKQELFEGGQTDEADAYLKTAQLIRETNKLLDENLYLDDVRRGNAEKLVEHAREMLEAEEERGRLDIRAVRYAAEREKLAQAEADAAADIERATRYALELDRERTREAYRVNAQLEHEKRQVDALVDSTWDLSDADAAVINALSREIELNDERVERMQYTLDLVRNNVDLSEELAEIERERANDAQYLADLEDERLDQYRRELRLGIANRQVLNQQRLALDEMLRSRDLNLDYTERQYRVQEKIHRTVAKQERAAREVADAQLDLHRNTVITYNLFERLRDLDPWIELRLGGRDVRRIMSQVANHSNLVSQSMQELGRLGAKALIPLQQAWKNLDGDVKLVLGLILSAGDQIAVLGSAAGAGLIALGAGISQAVVGIGGAIPIFLALVGDIEKLNSAMRPVREEFDAFRDQLSGTGRIIAYAGFTEMEGTFTSLKSSLVTLNPAFAGLGRTMGKVFDDFADAVAPGSDGLEEIDKLIRNTSKSLPKLTGAVGLLGIGFLRAFNRANPLVEDMYDWIGLLASRFDTFTRSSAFDDWLRNARTIFGELGPLIDAVARALNDMVTPESVDRTARLLNDLTSFTPVLGEILHLFGSLNVIGLLVQLLDDVLGSLEPVLPALTDVAEAVDMLASIAIEALAPAITAVATVLAAIIQPAADFLNALPEDDLRAVAEAVVAVAGAFLLLKGANGLLGVTDKVVDMVAGLRKAETQSKKTTRALSGLTKAGIVGAAVVGVIALGDALGDLYRDLAQIDDKARNIVADNRSFADAYREVGGATKDLTTDQDLLNDALNRLPNSGAGVGHFFDNMFGVFTQTQEVANGLTFALEGMDSQMAVLAQNNLPLASEQFAGWAAELGATDDQVLNMLEKMPEFKDALLQVAEQSGGVANDQDLVKLALEGTTTAMDEQTLAALDSEAANEAIADALAELEGKAAGAGSEVDDLADKIRNFGGYTLDTREAARQFESSVDDLRDSIKENGSALNDSKTDFDINTQAGRDNQAAVDDVVQSTLDHAAALYEQTGDQKLAKEAIDKGREALVKQLEKLGLSETAARDYADELNLIPENIDTLIDLDDTAAKRDIDNFINSYNGRTIKLGISAETIVGNPSLGFPQGATGGAVWGPGTGTSDTAGLFALSRGEHVFTKREVDAMGGQAAVYAFRRALSGGRGTSAVVGGGGAATGGTVPVASGRIVNVQDGAIRIEGATDPYLTSKLVVDRLSEMAVV